MKFSHTGLVVEFIFFEIERIYSVEGALKTRFLIFQKFF